MNDASRRYLADPRTLPAPIYPDRGDSGWLPGIEAEGGKERLPQYDSGKNLKTLINTLCRSPSVSRWAGVGQNPRTVIRANARQRSSTIATVRARRGLGR
jgi:hypothetical protein